MAGLSGLDAQDNVLGVIAEASAEDVDSTGMFGRLRHLDPEPDRSMLEQFQIAELAIGDAHTVDECAAVSDAETLQYAVLAAAQSFLSDLP